MSVADQMITDVKEQTVPTVVSVGPCRYQACVARLNTAAAQCCKIRGVSSSVPSMRSCYCGPMPVHARPVCWFSASWQSLLAALVA